ncbi:unnamed protein product [Gadus morhua 'NCC']
MENVTSHDADAGNLMTPALAFSPPFVWRCERRGERLGLGGAGCAATHEQTKGPSCLRCFYARAASDHSRPPGWSNCPAQPPLTSTQVAWVTGGPMRTRPHTQQSRPTAVVTRKQHNGNHNNRGSTVKLLAVSSHEGRREEGREHTLREISPRSAENLCDQCTSFADIGLDLSSVLET